MKFSFWFLHKYIFFILYYIYLVNMRGWAVKNSAMWVCNAAMDMRDLHEDVVNGDDATDNMAVAGCN